MPSILPDDQRVKTRNARAEAAGAVRGVAIRDHVLDATAVLCLLFAEEGCDRIESLLHRALISTVTHHEVLAKLSDLGVGMTEARAIIDLLDVEIVAVDRQQADLSGSLRGGAGGTSLSLGACAGLALAKTVNAVAVTTDVDWSQLDLGIRIIVIGQDVSRSV